MCRNYHWTLKTSATNKITSSCKFIKLIKDDDMGVTYECPGWIAWKPKLGLWKLYRGFKCKVKTSFFLKIEITEQLKVWNISKNIIDSSTVLHVTSLHVVRIITFWKVNLPSLWILMPNTCNGKGFKPCSGFTVYFFGRNFGNAFIEANGTDFDFFKTVTVIRFWHPF